MPVWVIGLISSVILKGVELLTKPGDCTDALCSIQARIEKMTPEDQKRMRKTLALVFGITKDDLSN